VLRELATAKEQRIGGLREEFSPVFCPDRSTLVFNSNRLGGRYDLWLQPVAPGGAAGGGRRLTDHPGSVSHPACSPDGRWVAYHRVLSGQRDIWVAPTRGGVPEQVTRDPAIDIQPDWSPDGSQLAFASDRGGESRIWVQRVVEGRPVGAARPLASGAGDAPAWSPDGSVIAYIGPAGDEGDEAWIVPADGSGAPRRVTHGATALRVRWERSSGLLIVSGRWDTPDISLRRVRAADGSQVEPVPGIRLMPDFPDFDASPDGKWLAFTREDTRGDLWLLEAQEGSY
jgi:Tol biopolymer transport system component